MGLIIFLLLLQIGVTPLPGNKGSGKLLHESLGARCLWESHWREEWCGIYEKCVSFYAPSTRFPCLEIAFIDITNVRPLDAGTLSPLPGFYILVLETAWLCHYVAFCSEEARDTFREKMQDATESHIKMCKLYIFVQCMCLTKRVNTNDIYPYIS